MQVSYKTSEHFRLVFALFLSPIFDGNVIRLCPHFFGGVRIVSISKYSRNAQLTFVAKPVNSHAL